MNKILFLLMLLPSIMYGADTVIIVTIPDANNVELLAAVRAEAGNQTMTATAAKAYVKAQFISVLRNTIAKYRLEIVRQQVLDIIKTVPPAVEPDNFAN